jgi:Peptidase family S41
LFFRRPAQSFGYFISPQWYPGPTTTVTFENGTEKIYTNQAQIRQGSYWSHVIDGDSFYTTFVVADTSGKDFRRDVAPKRQLHVPNRLQEPRITPDDGSGDIPPGFPEPDITGPSDVFINGYFLKHPNVPNLAVLAIQTFDTKTHAEAQGFQSVVQQFLAEAKSRGIEKVILDVQSNSGGRVFLGYDAFLQVRCSFCAVISNA